MLPEVAVVNVDRGSWRNCCQTRTLKYLLEFICFDLAASDENELVQEDNCEFQIHIDPDNYCE